MWTRRIVRERLSERVGLEIVPKGFNSQGKTCVDEVLKQNYIHSSTHFYIITERKQILEENAPKCRINKLSLDSELMGATLGFFFVHF